MRRARVWVVREEAGQDRVLGSGSECVSHVEKRGQITIR